MHVYMSVYISSNLIYFWKYFPWGAPNRLPLLCAKSMTKQKVYAWTVFKIFALWVEAFLKLLFFLNLKGKLVVQITLSHSIFEIASTMDNKSNCHWYSHWIGKHEQTSRFYIFPFPFNTSYCGCEFRSLGVLSVSMVHLKHMPVSARTDP